ncbi:hypothetical protein COOONC_23434 [Cooperia oncophora]
MDRAIAFLVLLFNLATLCIGQFGGFGNPYEGGFSGFGGYGGGYGPGSDDRFANHIRSCVPFYDLMQKHIKEGTGRRQQPFLSMTLVGAYVFPDYSVVTTEADGRFGQAVYCRYLDVNLKEITPAVESVVFPEFTVYCCRRSQAHYMSITTTKGEEINQTIQEYTLSMCVKPMYGSDTKFLLFAEYIEHYKLQGLIKHYVKSGEAEVVYFREKQDRPSIEWHLVGTQDCIHRSRHHSNYTIYADLDERILPTDTNTTLSAYTTKIMTEKPNIGMIRFVTQYVLKNGTDPVVYERSSTNARLSQQFSTYIHWIYCEVYHRSQKSFSDVGTSCGKSYFTGARWILSPHKCNRPYQHGLSTLNYRIPSKEKLFSTGLFLRHYRDIMSGDWYKYYLSDVEKFGPFKMTEYPPTLIEPLYQHVYRKLDLVYMS